MIGATAKCGAILQVEPAQQLIGRLRKAYISQQLLIMLLIIIIFAQNNTLL